MSTYLDNLGITFPDNTTQTTAYVPGQVITGSAMDTRDYVGYQSATGTLNYTWTKPTGTYNWVWVQLWAGGGGANGSSAAPSGGYTSVKIPYSQVPSSVSFSIAPNAGSWNGGGGVGVSATGFHPYCTATAPGATAGIPATQITQSKYQYLAPTSVVYTINESGSNTGQSGGTYSQLNGGGAAAPRSQAGGNNPGGSASPYNGNGGQYGGYARVLVKTFYQDPNLGI